MAAGGGSGGDFGKRGGDGRGKAGRGGKAAELSGGGAMKGAGNVIRCHCKVVRGDSTFNTNYHGRV